MPITKNSSTLDKKRAYRIRGKSAVSKSIDVDKETQSKHFLTIGPALPSVTNSIDHRRIKKRSHSTLGSTVNGISPLGDGKLSQGDPVYLQTTPDGRVHASRNQKEKEKHPDRISLDRRGLSVLPIIDGEPRLRLLSLQHNLLTKLDGLHSQNFIHLVFLDIYDNQLDRISSLDTLISLRVLLIGKNRIHRIEGLKSLTKLEVLDLHGNQISHVSGLTTLSELKVLNLAGNHIKAIGPSDLKGLKCLQEINLRRNKIKKLLGFGDTPKLEKLFVSNNDLQSVEDMGSVAKAVSLKEITIDSNPVSLGGDCVSFLVSYLPNLMLLSSMQVTDQVRKAAMAWRRNKEMSNAIFMDLSSDVSSNARREEVISNARTNWELLRSQTKCLAANTTSTSFKDLKTDSDFVLTSVNKSELNNATSLLSKHNLNILEKKLSFSKRSLSQETDNSQNTSSSNTSSNEFFRLPPILLPIINNLEQKSNRNENICLKHENDTKRYESPSSIGPNVDSSLSSLSSSTSSSSSSSEDEIDSDSNVKVKSVNKETGIEPNHKLPAVEPELQIASIPEERKSNDASSSLSTGTSSTVSNNSNNMNSVCSEATSSNSSIKSKESHRNIKSAVPNRRQTNHRINNRAVTARTKPKQLTSTTSPAPIQGKEKEQGGDYLVEICGRFLNVYGQGALRFIDRPWNTSKANDVNTVKFTYVNFNGITTILTKLKQRFPNAENFVFQETNINCIGQLNALAEVQGLTSLQIDDDGNPITEKEWQSYAIYRLSHWGLKMINGKEITEENIATANEQYQGLSDLVLCSLPEVLLQPLLMRLRLENSRSASQLSAKDWLWAADPALRSVVGKEALQWRRGAVSQEDLLWRHKGRLHLGSILESTCKAIEKLKQLEDEWPVILREIVQNTLVDYSQLDTYMKKKMQELK